MQPIQFQDPLYKQVHDKLRFVGEGPASFFRDVCRLLEKEEYNLESETHLISHLLREIESAVRDAIRTQDEKVTSGDDRHRRDIIIILDKLDIALDHPVAKTWLKLADSDFDFQFNKLAHRDSLNRPRRRFESMERVWEDFLTVLDVVIDKMQSNYFNATDLIDEILDQPPSKKRTKKLAGHIPHNETTLIYLFQNCDDPKWLPFLNEQGFFNHPPDIIYTDDNSYRYPRWPAAIFLQKMAGRRPDEVSEIIRQIPETHNRRVHEELVQAINQMPAEISASHTHLVLEWIRSGSLRHGSEPYFDLTKHLAQHGYKHESLSILQALLGPYVPEKKGSSIPRTTSDLRISDYEYEEFFENQMKIYRTYLKEDLIGLLSALLDDLLQLQYTPPEDVSYSWARHLSLDPDESTGSVYRINNHYLKTLLREINYLISHGTDYKRVLAYLEEYDWHIFSRIKLLLNARHDNLEEIKKVLLDAELFDSYWISREYKFVLNQFFPKLSGEEQQQILQWIETGLSSETMKKRIQLRDAEPTKEDIATAQRQWKWKKLAPIADHLDGELQDEFGELVEEFGPPQEDEDLFKVRSHHGPTSPKDADELAEFPVKDLLNYLENWEPSEEYGTPSRRGLGLALRKLVQNNPKTYSRHAFEFRRIEPTYIYHLVIGFRENVKEGEKIDWEPVLSLGEYALEQEDELESLEIDRLEEPVWLRIRKRIADLLSEGCRQKADSIPIQYRKQVWGIIHELTNDPQPDLDYEKEKSRDPMGLSINTARGEAMHAVFNYLGLIHKHLEETTEGVITFDDIPEVGELLERHLDLEYEPTLTIRSVYGQHIGKLVQVDPDWLVQHLQDVFPAGEELTSCFFAAWQGFITHHRAHLLHLEYLRPVYRQAIQRLEEPFDEWECGLMPDRRLAEHLLGYYWHGDLPLNDELLSLFFEHAPTELKGYIFEYIGRSLDNYNCQVPKEVLTRLKQYIEFRIEQAKSVDDSGNSQKELAQAGWCLATGCFEPEWTLHRLKEVLGITPTLDHSRMVMQQLPEYVEDYPERVLDCIEPMVKNTDRTLDLQVWRESLKKILAVLTKKDDNLAKRAKELIQHISHRRFHLMQEFKPLLE